MQCEKFEARLMELLDERQRPESDALLTAHAEACERCRDTLVLSEQLFAGLEMWESPAPPADFSRRVLATYHAEQSRGGEYAAEIPVAELARPTKGSRWLYRAIACAVAASVLVAVVVAWKNRDENGNTVAKQPETPPEQPATVESPAIVSTHQGETIPEGNVEVPPEARLEAQELVALVENAELPNARATGRMIREVTTTLPEVPVVEERIPALRPITSGFNTTIGMFRRTIPGTRAPREEQKAPPMDKPQAGVLGSDEHVV